MVQLLHNQDGTTIIHCAAVNNRSITITLLCSVLLYRSGKQNEDSAKMSGSAVASARARGATKIFTTLHIDQIASSFSTTLSVVINALIPGDI